MSVSVLAVIAGFVAVFIVLVMVLSRPKSSDSGGDRSRLKKKAKSREAIVRDATRRLAANPRDPIALKNMGDIYFQEEAWGDALKTYEILTELAHTSSAVDEFEVNLRYGLSALKLNMETEAYKGFTAARSLRQNNFDVNYNLGYLEFQKKNYEKAAQLFQLARRQNPENAPVLRCLGHALFRMKRLKEAVTFIRQAIDIAPDDKESLYTLGECYYEAGQADQAMRLFSQLRMDPVLGPGACLLSGAINTEQHNTENAIRDFETGLKHQNLKPDILIDLRYRLANAYITKNDIGNAMTLLEYIYNEAPAYKDVAMLIGKYRELKANRNFRIYLMAPSADFLVLCRKIVMGYYSNAKVKITNTEFHNNEWVDLLAEVDMSEIIMFRFIRTQGSIGELVVRDFHAHFKEMNARRGICATVGSFGDEAKRYTEARLIDLIEKDQLFTILNAVEAASPGVQDEIIGEESNAAR
ncbi:hypothetical protein AGMMS49579_23200 [Spirochaetia bacterium]|nr:hypothetical protein AGMMS49579_23200 [Spirochaetia bacterium]